MPRGKYESANRTPDHIRQAILAADPSVSNQALADKHGVGYNTVWSLRKSAGIKVTRAAGGGKQEKARSAKPAPAAIVRHPQVKSEERAIQRAIEPAAPIVITGGISPAAAEKFWSILSVEQKQQIVKASIFSILNPAQEA